MPALPIIVDTHRVALRWTTPTAQSAVNVIHIHAPGSGGGTDPIFEVLEDAVHVDQWVTAAVSASITTISITPLDGISATHDYTPSVPASWTGGQAGEYSPATSVLVKLTTADRGRSNRGRVYLPFTAEQVMSDGVLTAGPQAAAQTAWDAFSAALTADPTTPSSFVVASYKLARDLAVTTINVEGILATQRRRQGRLRGA